MPSRKPLDGRNFDSRGSHRPSVKPVCRVSVASFLLVGISFAVPSPIQREVIRIPSGSPIAVDGKVSANEWDYSKFVMLPVAKNWIVPVRFKHDTENLYFEFESVKRGSQRLFPEILIDQKNRKSETWEPVRGGFTYRIICARGMASRTCTPRTESSSAVTPSRDGRGIILRRLTPRWWR